MSSTSIPIISWNNYFPTIETNRLILRKVQANDLTNYQQLFSNTVVMEKYSGGVKTDSQTKIRLTSWISRWEKHRFSAFCITYKTRNVVWRILEKLFNQSSEQFVGHVILGHGDYENSTTHGWSEMALIIRPAYWNKNYHSKSISTLQQTHIGLEVVNAIYAYAKCLFLRGEKVPVDVSPSQIEEVEQKLKAGEISDVLRDSNGQITAAMIPFREIRATSKIDNVGGCSILKKVFIDQGKGIMTEKPGDAQRLMYSKTF